MPRQRRKDPEEDFKKLLDANKAWAASMRAQDPDFFKDLCDQQNPEYLWIGCSDSRVPANQILDLAPGEVFVHRNVGNQALHTDLNQMACLEFAVKSLKVKTIMVCGHYNCGAVKAALQLPIHMPGLVNCWISDIRQCRNEHEAELKQHDKPEAQLARLCELNVLRQVFHVCTSPIVASAWADGQEVHVWGVIYSLEDGLLRRLVGPISADSDYEHTLGQFTASGLQLARGPNGQLRVTNEDGQVTSLKLDSSADGQPEGGATKCPTAGDLRELRSLDSEIRTAVNNISLLDKIERHTSWAAPR